MRWRGAAVVASMLACACTRESPVERSPKPAPATSTLHFGGDVFFGESYTTPLEGAARYEAPFTKLDSVLGTAPVIANLETALVLDAVSPHEGKKDYLHWSRPTETAAALGKRGFVALSLSNNHAMDYGLDAIRHTQAALDQHKVASFGAGASTEQASAPFVLDLSTAGDPLEVTVIGAYWFRKKYRDRYHFYAEGSGGGVRRLDDGVLSQVRAQKSQHPGREVVVFPHWGKNYRWRNEEQRRWAHALVDAGADWVIGHGAHAHQEIERYKGRWILYGLGNLVFLTPGRYDEHDMPAVSLLASLRFHAGGRGQHEVQLRFISSDNKVTDYRPHFLTGEAFREAAMVLETKSCTKERPDWCADLRRAADDTSPHLVLKR